MPLPSQNENSEGFWTGRQPIDTRQGQEFSFVHIIKTGFKTHPDSCPMNIGSKAVEADHSPPNNIDIENGGAIPPLPHMSLWHSA
jgi:hypothetical protein